MPKGVPNFPKARAPYATQACTICRARKSKCDGARPVCGSCQESGREGECSWGRDTLRKPRTEAHFEALRKRADALEAYVEQLEGMLAKCVCQDVSGHLELRPQQLGGQLGNDEPESGTDSLDSDEEIIKELSVPTQSLKLDDRLGNLILHGVAGSSFRFGNRPPSQVPPTPKVVENTNASYVLQLEGVDVSQTHPNIDWSRYLPADVALERREHDRILDVAFKFFTFYGFRVVPSLFLRDMYRALSVPRSEKPPRTSHYSPMLHNALLSVITVYSDDPYLRDPQTRHHFVSAAKALLEAECRKPDVNLVHALAFIGTFYGDMGERILSELFCGQSNRLSVTLGLGVDATPWVKAGLISREEQIERNWAHWTNFSLDVCWALYFGRDFGGPRRKIPMPFVDSEMDQIPWYHAPANIPPQPNYTTLMFLQSSALFEIAREIVDVVNAFPSSAGSRAKGHERVTRIDLELNNWKSQLPPQLEITLANRANSTPQRLILHLGYWWCFIVLHQPFISRRVQPIQHPDREVDHVKLCTRAAENILELVETWQSLYTLRLAPVTMVQVVFNAGIIFLLRALQATASPRIAHGALNTALAQVETCVQYLHEVGGTWLSGVRLRDTLQAILNDRLRPIIARRLSHKGEQIPAATLSSSSPPPEKPVPSFAGEPIVAGVLSTMPAPTYTTSTLVSNAPSVQNWSQSIDFFTQLQNVPAASAFGAESLYPGGGFADVDMTALLPNIDYFGAPELWEQPEFNGLWEEGLNFGALDDDRTAAAGVSFS